jgi:hypothetical protein
MNKNMIRFALGAKCGTGGALGWLIASLVLPCSLNSESKAKFPKPAAHFWSISRRVIDIDWYCLFMVLDHFFNRYK